MSLRLPLAVLLACCLLACGGKKAVGDDATTDAGGGDGTADLAADVTDLNDLGVDDAEPGTDADDGDTDQAVTEVTLLDIPDGCQKSCKNPATGMPKICGPDGCGSVCGFCPSGKFCNKDQSACTDFCQKVCTTPAGKAKTCGDDGCGGQCGLCDSSFNCGIDFLCHPNDCKPTCTGKVCGDDGCGKNCGVCATIEYCSDAGQCVKSACAGVDVKGNCEGDLLITCEGADALAKKVVKDCSVVLPTGSKTCGYDIPNQKNNCIQKICKPSCKLPDGTVKKCGDDGCGGTCGSCPTGWGCPAGTCKPVAGAACGSLVTTAGYCDADNPATWVYCQNGKVAMLDCSPQQCQWNQGTSSFACL